MSIYELRETIESAIPWWLPIAIGLVLAAIAFVIGRKAK